MSVRKCFQETVKSDRAPAFGETRLIGDTAFEYRVPAESDSLFPTAQDNVHTRLKYSKVLHAVTVYMKG